MADAHVISEAVTAVLKNGHCCEVSQVARGEMAFHLAELYDQLGEERAVTPSTASEAADRFRRQGRTLLGGVA